MQSIRHLPMPKWQQQVSQAGRDIADPGRELASPGQTLPMPLHHLSPFTAELLEHFSQPPAPLLAWHGGTSNPLCTQSTAENLFLGGGKDTAGPPATVPPGAQLHGLSQPWQPGTRIVLGLQLLCFHLRSSMRGLAESGLFPKSLLAHSCRSKGSRASPADPSLLRTSPAFPSPPGMLTCRLGAERAAAAVPVPSPQQVPPHSRDAHGCSPAPGRGPTWGWDQALG